MLSSDIGGQVDREPDTDRQKSRAQAVGGRGEVEVDKRRRGRCKQHRCAVLTALTTGYCLDWCCTRDCGQVREREARTYPD